MKQILINYLSFLNAFRNDINYYRYEVPDDPADGKEFEGFQTNEPISHYCVLSAGAGHSFDHVISICTDKVRKDAYSLAVERTEEYPVLQKLANYAKGTDGVYEMGQVKKGGEVIDCYRVQHYAYFMGSILDDCSRNGIKSPEFHKLSIGDKPSDAEVRNMIVTVGNEIQRCVCGKRGDYRVVLDCTGGDRASAVMVIALTKILEDTGFGEIKLMGSNYDPQNTKERPVPVREKAEMGQIFDLISGTRIFLSYGDSNALNEFFRDTGISETDEKVFRLIQDFSDAIKLCNAEEMHNRLKSLVNVIMGREPSENPLFEYVLDAIKRDFSGTGGHDNLLHKANITEINIIRWCLRKGLIQQAVTFYAERLPVAFVEQGIVYYAKPGNWDLVRERYYNKWNVDIIIYENEMHNQLIYERYSPDADDENRQNTSPTYFKESVKFFDRYVKVTDGEIQARDEVLIGEEYRVDPEKMRKLAVCIKNYKEFRNVVRNGMMHANIRRGKMRNIMRWMETANGELPDQMISPDSIKLLMLELIAQLNEIGMK